MQQSYRSNRNRLPQEKIFKCAGGNQISVQGLVMQLNQALGCDINPKFADPRPGDVKNSPADISRAGSLSSI